MVIATARDGDWEKEEEGAEAPRVREDGGDSRARLRLQYLRLRQAKLGASQIHRHHRRICRHHRRGPCLQKSPRRSWWSPCFPWRQGTLTIYSIFIIFILFFLFLLLLIMFEVRLIWFALLSIILSWAWAQFRLSELDQAYSRALLIWFI